MGNTDKQTPRITIQYLKHIRSTIQIGDELTYYSTEQSELNNRIVLPREEQVIVTDKHPHLVTVINPYRPDGDLKTITYKEIAFRRQGLSWAGIDNLWEKVNGKWRRKAQ